MTWAVNMAVGLGTGVPYVICKQEDAPYPIRYKISVCVKDDTGVINFTTFNGEANKILKKSVGAFLERYTKGGLIGLLPEEFGVLLNTKFAFKVDITSFNIQIKYDLFRIAKMTDEASVIDRLDSVIDRLENQIIFNHKLNYYFFGVLSVYFNFKTIRIRYWS